MRAGENLCFLTKKLRCVVDDIVAVPAAEDRFEQMADDSKSGLIFALVYRNDAVVLSDVDGSNLVQTVR